MPTGLASTHVNGGRSRLADLRARLGAIACDVRASDGLVSFSVMWAVALVFSVASHVEDLLLLTRRSVAIMDWLLLALCAAMLLQPRRTWLLGVLAAVMAGQYMYRLPVASNNQTIAFFMNCAIVVVIAIEALRGATAAEAREVAYERLRIVARYLLATMYFFGIFHKINTDFLDPQVSCAVALYIPLTQSFGLEDNLIGRYGAIASTFIVEAIAIVALFWKRYFAVGLIIGLVFHYAIPISAYSWYMDFSALVFALYILSVPREVSLAFYTRGRMLLRRLPVPSGGVAALVALALLLATSVALVNVLAIEQPPRTTRILWHSVWIVMWAVVGGIAMVVMTRAALEALPYRALPVARQPSWLLVLPALLFLTCLSPYVGLKTESSIAMFSNLHTEGGESNHLLMPRPPYAFDYQRSVARIEASSHPEMQRYAERRLALVRFSLEKWMRAHPREWVTFTIDGVRYVEATPASFALSSPSFIERRLLTFKPVDFARPKTCTH